VIPALASLLALQKLDSAADDAAKRLEELPAVEAALDERVAAAATAVDAARARLAENHAARRTLEKDVAAVDARLARFNDHKAAVKTNQEFTALLSEIDTARAEKDRIEERILLLLEEADAIEADVAAAEADVAAARKDGEATRRELASEHKALEERIATIDVTRKGELAGLEPALLARYQQLRKGRRGIAVTAMTGEICSACLIRLRPHVVQQVRRNDEIVQCESCQRILYFEPGPDEAGA